jgi:AraC-like DNA-binding protein
MAPVWRVIPHGKISMLFLYGDAHQYSLNGPDEEMLKTRQAFLVGQMTKPLWIKYSGHTRLIKIQFKASGLQQLLPMNMSEFTDVPSLDLEAVWGSPVNQLLEQMHEAPTDEDRISLLNRFFEKRLLPENDQIDYVTYTLARLNQTNGKLKLGTLEEKLGISTRQLERLFKTRVGLSPKEMSRIIRLNGAFSHLQADPDLSLTSLSYESGYYDQAHFSREFKDLAGVSPSRILSESAKELFVTHGQCFVKGKPAEQPLRRAAESAPVAF